MHEEPFPYINIQSHSNVRSLVFYKMWDVFLAVRSTGQPGLKVTFYHKISKLPSLLYLFSCLLRPLHTKLPLISVLSLSPSSPPIEIHDLPHPLPLITKPSLLQPWRPRPSYLYPRAELQSYFLVVRLKHLWTRVELFDHRPCKVSPLWSITRFPRVLMERNPKV